MKNLLNAFLLWRISLTYLNISLAFLPRIYQFSSIFVFPYVFSFNLNFSRENYTMNDEVQIIQLLSHDRKILRR